MPRGYARHARIEHVTQNLAVAGSVDLSENPLKALPDDFSVPASLNLNGCPIAALPDNLTIGRDLHVVGTGLHDLLASLIVGRQLYLSDRDAIAIAPDAQLGGVVVFTLDTGGSVPDARVMRAADYTPPARLP